MPRIRWKAQLTSQDIAPMITTTTNSIAAIQVLVGVMVPYNAGGAQQAVTTVNWPPALPVASATTAQQHSEMVALGKTLNAPAIWQVDAAGRVAAVNGNAIAFPNYSTNLPHCGYCTVMLFVLGLPIGVATRGNYNLAVNLEYTVPPQVFDNFNSLARLVNNNVAGNAGWVVIKNMINPFIQTPPSADWVLQVGADYVTNAAVVNHQPANTEVLDWTADAKNHLVRVNEQYYGQNSLLKTLWKFVYQGIYANGN